MVEISLENVLLSVGRVIQEEGLSRKGVYLENLRDIFESVYIDADLDLSAGAQDSFSGAIKAILKDSPHTRQVYDFVDSSSSKDLLLSYKDISTLYLIAETVFSALGIETFKYVKLLRSSNNYEKRLNKMFDNEDLEIPAYKRQQERAQKESEANVSDVTITEPKSLKGLIDLLNRHPINDGSVDSSFDMPRFSDNPSDYTVPTSTPVKPTTVPIEPVSSLVVESIPVENVASEATNETDKPYSIAPWDVAIFQKFGSPNNPNYALRNEKGPSLINRIVSSAKEYIAEEFKPWLFMRMHGPTVNEMRSYTATRIAVQWNQEREQAANQFLYGNKKQEAKQLMSLLK